MPSATLPHPHPLRPYAAAMPKNAEAEALKERRRAATPTPDPEKLVQTDRPVQVGLGEPPRVHVLLGHPDEPRAIIGGEPFNANGVTGEDYIRATEDAYETITPPGCRTATARLLWKAGMQVPVERYRAWEATRKPAAE